MKAAIYVRCSTDKQDTDMQLHDLKLYCVLHKLDYDIFEDYYSGTKLSRPSFDLLLQACRDGKYNKVVVWKFDRLSRNVRDFLNIFHELNEVGCAIVSFKDGIDPSSGMGKAMLHIMMALSELEVENIRERTKAGLRAARARGSQIGPKPKPFDAIKFQALLRKNLHMDDIAKELGYSRSQLYRVVKKHALIV